MQRQEIEQTIYKMAQQLPAESLEEVLQFMKLKTRNKANTQNWQHDFLAVSQWDINEAATAYEHNFPIATLNRKHFENIEQITLIELKSS